MVNRDTDALCATEAAAKLLEIGRRLEDQALHPQTMAMTSALRAAADLLAECLTPPASSATDALVDVIITGVRQKMTSSQ